MKLVKFLKLALIITFLTFQCKTINVKSLKESNELFFYLKTTNCMGSCPVFTFSIYSNGDCIYEGTDNVKNIGNYTGKINSEDLSEFKIELEELNFLNITIKNDKLVKDLPTRYLFFSNGISENKITYYYPENKKIDSVLVLTQQLIDQINWKEDTN